MLQHAAAHMQHISQSAAYCPNQDLLDRFESNFAIEGCLGWQSCKKRVDCDIMLHLQHTAAYLQQICANAAYCVSLQIQLKIA